ncbi:MAG TPA: glycosyltransferase family 9 protein [Nitrospira sp.]|nr:glycosyltransferase family 9 protein [Nitrospira sp.]
MSKQVLIINVTRMGDLVQMGGLLARLQVEWPGAAVDLVVDTRFAPVASMLPGLRHIITYDFHGLIEETRAMVKDVVSAYREMAAWVKPLWDARYDRIINLTFDKRSALLASYIGAPDIRGVACAQDGTTIVKNPWLSYFTDCHAYRRFNRFNLVDIYALGGSSLGPARPLSLSVPVEATEWAKTFVNARLPGRVRIAVQVGASDVMKAWRPDYFGRTMALISRQANVGFVLIGTAEEAAAAEQAGRAYQAANGRAPWCEAIGRTTVIQLTALLAECRLLLTNDTGPMHLAVGVGTPVIDVSVGHVNFWETGPYGPGHWVIQPDLECAPCGFDRVCLHHACKDQIQCADVASLCRHVLGIGPMPDSAGASRMYESGIDGDGLGTFTLRIGRADPLTEWYGLFWRTFWYETLAKRPSSAKHPSGPPPDRREADRAFEELQPLLAKLVAQSEHIDRLCRRQPPPVVELREAHRVLQQQQQSVVASAMIMPSLIPITVAFLREIHNNDAAGLTQMSGHHMRAYRLWQQRVSDVRRRLQAAWNESDAARLIMPAARATQANTVPTGLTL